MMPKKARRKKHCDYMISITASFQHFRLHTSYNVSPQLHFSFLANASPLYSQAAVTTKPAPTWIESLT